MAFGVLEVPSDYIRKLGFQKCKNSFILREKINFFGVPIFWNIWKPFFWENIRICLLSELENSIFGEYKKFFNIKARKFQFSKHKGVFLGWTFFIFWACVKSVPGSSMLYCSSCVAKFGLQLSVEAWNHHLNFLKGPPADLMV